MDPASSKLFWSGLGRLRDTAKACTDLASGNDSVMALAGLCVQSWAMSKSLLRLLKWCPAPCLPVSPSNSHRYLRVTQQLLAALEDYELLCPIISTTSGLSTCQGLDILCLFPPHLLLDMRMTDIARSQTGQMPAVDSKFKDVASLARELFRRDQVHQYSRR